MSEPAAARNRTPPSLKEAREDMLRAALNVLIAERHLASTGGRFFLPEADGNLYLAARDLYEAVERLPLNRKPRGWDE